MSGKPAAASRPIVGEFRVAFEAARLALTENDPIETAARAGVLFDGRRFIYRYFGMVAETDFPSGDCRIDGGKAPGAEAVLMLHNLVYHPRIEPSGRWISFREIRDAAAYLSAFTRRGPETIAARFGDEMQLFRLTARSLGGRSEPDLPGEAWTLEALPEVMVAVILFEGEPGLPASAQILFDAGLQEFLPAEDMAVLGEATAGVLVRQAELANPPEFG